MAEKPKNPHAQLPHKRPRQSRAQFTVDTLYDGFVRIWRRDGPEAATTRAIAEETGYAVGTLYEYFPNTTALLSGYVRNCIEQDIVRLREYNLSSEGKPWLERLYHVIRVTAGQHPNSPYLDHEMLLREGLISEERHHRHAFERLAQIWVDIVSSWPDLPVRPAPETIRLMFLMVWGVRRYKLIAQVKDSELGNWLDDIHTMCRALLHADRPSAR
ncbi:MULTISPECIES: TetR/AcrR family transcriptional regulator [Roseobacteraceae]|uniref:Bacterial regulatory protein, tetR family n=1 Tax=Pseudosulfitobacter pseudonitzschiae TaxID=1402135 RepID=A0A221K7L1_9RHOB|nr:MULTISPECIES: TetR/AcrR family transcriptional regulator [Roseobacteraceae]ASM74860.1 bacterial regulatory protein, tetR family [Pseudosulfitobacter pseudonitzschiae]